MAYGEHLRNLDTFTQQDSGKCPTQCCIRGGTGLFKGKPISRLNGSPRMDYVERESALATAEGEGLRRRETLFARTPVHYSTDLRRQAGGSVFMVCS
mgnify:CR=1 FL=1